MIRPTHWWLPLRIRTADALFWLLVVAFLIVMCSSITFAQTCPDGNCPTGNCPPQWTAPQRITAPPRITAPQRRTQAPPQIVRISNTMQGFVDWGSGTIVADNGTQALILSCGHLFREGQGTVEVVGSWGRSRATFVTVDKDGADISAIAIASPRVGIVEVATDRPAMGAAIVASGYGSGSYHTTDGRIRLFDGRQFEVTGVAQDGDSGGPVLERGRLVGVIWGTDDQVIRATCCHAIRPFLQRVRDRLRWIRQPPLVVLPGPGVLPVPPPAVIDLRLVAIVEDHTRRIEALEGTPGPQGERGLPGMPGPQGPPGNAPDEAAIVARVVADVIARLPVDDAPLFFVVHRDPETGEIIPQTDPTTGATYTVQPINRGDDWTIYLPPQSQPGDD